MHFLEFKLMDAFVITSLLLLEAKGTLYHEQYTQWCSKRKKISNHEKIRNIALIIFLQNYIFSN